MRHYTDPQQFVTRLLQLPVLDFAQFTITSQRCGLIIQSVPAVTGHFCLEDRATAQCEPLCLHHPEIILITLLNGDDSEDNDNSLMIMCFASSSCFVGRELSCLQLHQTYF